MSRAWFVAWLISGSVVASACGKVGDGHSGPSSLVDITASGAVMGQEGKIRVYFSNPVADNTDVTLTSAATATATVADHVTVAAGAVSAEIPYTAITPGLAVFHASAGGATQTTTATVVDVLRINTTNGATFEVGAHGIISQGVNITVPDAVTLSLASSQSSIAAIDNELTIPAFNSSGLAQITAMSPGASVITASFNGQQATQTVTIVDKARIVQVYGTNVFEVGGHGLAQVGLNAQVATATAITVTPSDPSVVNVPRVYTVAAGSNYASFDVKGMAVGSANLVFSINGSSGTLPIVVLDKAQLENLSVNSTPSVGDSTQLVITMNAVAATSHDIALSSSDPAVVTVPAIATVFAGTSSASVAITPSQAGAAVVTATYNGISRQIPIAAGTSGYVLNLYGQGRYVVGALGELSIQTGLYVPSTVTLVSSDPSVASVPSSLVVYGSETAPVAMLRAGTAIITATTNGASATFPIAVVASAGIQQFGPSFAVPINGSINGNLYLDTQPPVGTTITFSTSDAAIAPAPASISVQNGQNYIPFVVRGGNTGTATLTANLAGSHASAAVFVGGTTRSGTFIGLFPGGPSTMEIGAAVLLSAQFSPAPPNGDTGAITFGTPGILTTPSPTLAISAANCCTSFPVVGAVAGSSDVTVTASDVSQTTTLKVVSAAGYQLQLPATVKVNASVTALIVADAVLAADRTATLSSSNTNVATVTTATATIGPGGASQQAAFGVRGVAAGTATITATIRGTSYTANITVQ